MLDLECMLVDLFHWSLRDIDDTDIETLIPFVFRYPAYKKRAKGGRQKEVYADQVEL